MQNVSDIYAAWPSDAELARDLGVPYPTISAWKQRASIPAAYWWHLTRAARSRGHPEITAELLARLHARKMNDGHPAALEEEQTSPYGLGPAAEAEAEGAARRDAGDKAKEASGHFGQFKHLRRAHFASAEEINAHISALRDEWDRR